MKPFGALVHLLRVAYESLELSLLLEGVLSVFYPRRCPFCGEVIGFRDACDATICTNERQKELLKTKALDPKKHYFGELAGAAAVCHYKGVSRSAILELKYNRNPQYAHELGNVMAKEFFGCTFEKKYGIVVTRKAERPILAYNVIIPVPSSNRKRGYNVPTLLAKPLARGLGIPLLPDALQRVSFTRHQARLSLQERLVNVSGAFRAQKGLDLSGKNVLLVDDVITTGATITACAQALRAAGAEDVFAVAFASAQGRTQREASAYLEELNTRIMDDDSI